MTDKVNLLSHFCDNVYFNMLLMMKDRLLWSLHCHNHFSLLLSTVRYRIGTSTVVILATVVLFLSLLMIVGNKKNDVQCQNSQLVRY